MLTVGSLFSGIGAFEVGLERAGMRVAWQVEIDPVCRSVLARHWPDVERHADIRDVGRHNLGPVDLICGGFPCQDLSIAGKGAGLAGARSRLFWELARIVKELQPRFALIENVPRLLSSHSGRDFTAVLRALRECGARDIGWRVLDARYFGVAQARRRLFIVADFRGECAGEILFEPEGVSGSAAPSGGEGTRVAATLTSGSGGRSNPAGRRGEDDVNLVPVVGGPLRAQSQLSHREDADTLIVSTLQGGSGAHGYRYDAEGAAGGHLVPTRVAGSLTARYGKGAASSADDCLIGMGPLGFDMAQITSKQNRATVGGDRAMPTLVARSQMHGAHALTAEGADASEDGTGRGTPRAVSRKVTAFAWQQGDDSPRDGGKSRAYIVRAGDYAAGLRHSRHDAVAGEWGVRRLTPTECERLQGVPDGWTATGADGKAISDSARYRMLGNAVCASVSYWFGQRFADVVAAENRNREVSNR